MTDEKILSTPASLAPSVATRLREQMPVSGDWAYFDHAAVAPISRPAQQAIQQWATESATQGDTVWPQWERRVEELRGLAARLINASPAEIALVPNTTAGVNIVAEGFPWQVGDNIVTLENEFPSNLYPWMNLASRGVEVRRVPVPGGVVDLNRIADACDDRTRIVSVSWVGYASGWRISVSEVADVAHAAGALFFLDAIQGLGVFPLDVAQDKVDFLAADGHKWMLGPEGAGIFYCKQEHLTRLQPTAVGWNSVVGRYAFDKVDLNLRDSAARYEGGSANMVGLHGLAASLELLMDLGAGPNESTIGDAVIAITNEACRQLESVGARLITRREPGHESGIVVFDLPEANGQSLAAIRNHCTDAGVALSARGGGLRISPHAYTNNEDLSRLVDVLTDVRVR